MGDSDKMNEHISAYLENTLDPATRAEFEKELDRFPELKNTTNHVLKLASLLGKLPDQKCSNDFVLKLRQKINSAPVHKPGALNVKRYSFAFSFAIIILVAIWGINNLLKKEEPALPLPSTNEFQSAPSSVSGRPINTPVKNYSTGTELDIKTRAESKMIKDSTDIRKVEQDDLGAKQVGHIPK